MLRYSDRIVARFGSTRTLLGGMTLVAAGLALFSQAPPGGAYDAG